jgi:hypothetical protein
MSASFFNHQWRARTLLACHIVDPLLLPSRLVGGGHPTARYGISLTCSCLPCSISRGMTPACGPRPGRLAACAQSIWALARDAQGCPSIQRRPRAKALYAFLTTLIVMLLFRAGFSARVILLGWQRPSHSLVVEGARPLERYPRWPA